jgi:ATP-dependent Clp protease ATP-binding subunit ClpA
MFFYMFTLMLLDNGCASLQNIRRIVDVRLKEVATRLSNRHVTLDVAEAGKEWLAEHGMSFVVAHTPKSLY